MLAEKQKPWSKTRKYQQKSKDHGRRHENISRETKTLVDIPDTKVVAFKLLSEGFKPWSLPWNHRPGDAADILKTKPIGYEVK
jgi:hypothetical protein